MTTPKLTKAQREALEIFSRYEDEGCAESWLGSSTRGPEHLRFLNHDRTLNALERRGLIDAEGHITDAGRAALKDGAE